MNDLGYWIPFTHISTVETAKFRMLEKYFGGLDRAWHANASALVAAGLEDRMARTIEEKRALIHPDKELEKLAKYSVRAINWHDDFYPKRLKEIYDPPPENAQLVERISENGAVISEYHIGMKPMAENFPRSNRLRSGISLGVLVVEANASSGALITANQAVGQDRDVLLFRAAYSQPLAQA
ncbi:MAG: hypothetical protein EXR59_04570, partial [Dehalococcoidia bacterium]|nr:hypothetical protein [Dehalococcoidia bacterium]